MSKPTIDIEVWIHTLCESTTTAELVRWKKYIEEDSIKDGLNPDGEIGRIFIGIIDSHIKVNHSEQVLEQFGGVAQ